MPPEGGGLGLADLASGVTILSDPWSASICDPVGIWRASVSGTNPVPLLSAAPSAAVPSDLPGGGLMNTTPETGVTSTDLPSTGGGGAPSLPVVKV